MRISTVLFVRVGQHALQLCHPLSANSGYNLSWPLRNGDCDVHRVTVASFRWTCPDGFKYDEWNCHEVAFQSSTPISTCLEQSLNLSLVAFSGFGIHIDSRRYLHGHMSTLGS